MFGLDDMIGYFASTGQRQAQQDALGQATQTYRDLNGTPGADVNFSGAPTDAASQWLIKNNPAVAQHVLPGVTSPDYSKINAQETAPTAYNDINVDPGTRDAQMKALSQMAGVADAGGMDPGSIAALEQAQAKNAQVAKSSNDAALERARAEGRLNSGRALSATMQANQAAANTNAMAGTQAAADARTRAMQAMAAEGSMAGGVRDQDYSQAANKAQATDMINQFNANQRQNAAQQTFGNKATVAGGVAGGLTAQAGQQAQQASQINNIAQGYGRAVATAATMGMGGIGGAIPAAAGAAGAAGGAKASGGMIEGHAPHPGDDERNDVVPARLSPGEIVIPRSVVAKGPDAARKFIEHLLAGG